MQIDRAIIISLPGNEVRRAKSVESARAVCDDVMVLSATRTDAHNMGKRKVYLGHTISHVRALAYATGTTLILEDDTDVTEPELLLDLPMPDCDALALCCVVAGKPEKIGDLYRPPYGSWHSGAYITRRPHQIASAAMRALDKPEPDSFFDVCLYSSDVLMTWPPMAMPRQCTTTMNPKGQPDHAETMRISWRQHA